VLRMLSRRAADHMCCCTASCPKLLVVIFLLPPPCLCCAGKVIKGWDSGVATMKKGELANLVCRCVWGGAVRLPC
jgi:hypothetical protein